MSSIRSTKNKNSYLRPIAVGVLVSIAVILVLICIVSLVFAAIECIAENAAAPIIFLAIAAGCFLGAYIAAASIGNKGLVVGAVIAVIIFLILLIAGCINSKLDIGINALLKFLILLFSGCCGGYMAVNRRYSRKVK